MHVEVAGYLLFLGTISVSLLFDCCAVQAYYLDAGKSKGRALNEKIWQFNLSYYDALVHNPFIKYLRAALYALLLGGLTYRITLSSSRMRMLHLVAFLVGMGAVKCIVHPARDRLLGCVGGDEQQLKHAAMIGIGHLTCFAVCVVAVILHQYDAD